MVCSLVCAFNDSMVGSYAQRTVSWTDVPKVGDRLIGNWLEKCFILTGRSTWGGEGLPPLTWYIWRKRWNRGKCRLVCVCVCVCVFVHAYVCVCALTLFRKQLRDVCEDELHYNGLNPDLHEGCCTVKPSRLNVLWPEHTDWLIIDWLSGSWKGRWQDGHRWVNEYCRVTEGNY